MKTTEPLTVTDIEKLMSKISPRPKIEFTRGSSA